MYSVAEGQPGRDVVQRAHAAQGQKILDQGRGRDAVHIVIAPDRDFFAVLDGRMQKFRPCPKSRPLFQRGEMSEAGIQKPVHILFGRQAAQGHEPHQKRADFQTRGQMREIALAGNFWRGFHTPCGVSGSGHGCPVRAGVLFDKVMSVSIFLVSKLQPV